MAELRHSEDVQGIENARWTVIREIEKLMKGHNELADKLDSTHHYLQLIESDSRQLTDELTRVRLLSLTDELTGLPNRRDFMRRLEDEVARVQRYGFPLSFALIDLDHFKSINDEFGHQFGDKILIKVADIFVRRLGADGRLVRLGIRQHIAEGQHEEQSTVLPMAFELCLALLLRHLEDKALVARVAGAEPGGQLFVAFTQVPIAGLDTCLQFRVKWSVVGRYRIGGCALENEQLGGLLGNQGNALYTG